MDNYDYGQSYNQSEPERCIGGAYTLFFRQAHKP
jgi:hypothetical protein